MCEDSKSGMHHKVKKRYGSSVEHGRAHEKDHQRLSRRDFLYSSGLAGLGASLMLAGRPVGAMLSTPLLAGLSASDCDRTLVLIRLKGGNDGLNTIIHRDNDEYYNIRPNIAIQEADLWALSDDFGMPNVTTDLQSFWNEGKMKVIHNVGYPNANYSHFRSSDIWASASDSDERIRTGWIGRLMDYQLPAFMTAPPTVPPALQIGVQTNLVFQAPSANMALSISNPTEFYQIAQSGQLYDTSQLGNCPREQELAFVRQSANSAFRYSETIRDAYNQGSNNVNYPANDLAEQMAIVARLIKGNLGTKIYMVSIGGFDTHADQLDLHPILLNELATAVNAFFADLNQGGIDQEVLAMTFSEFGRTIFENGSLGTDHGTGAPSLLFGGDTLGSGFVGEAPDLENVDMYGDPYFKTDFRSIYATILQDWLCVDPKVVDFVIGKPIDRINGLVPAGTSSQGANDNAALLGHNPSPNNSTQIDIKYAMKSRGNIRLQILDTAGHPIRTLINEFKEAGSYTFAFRPADYFLSSGQYIYRLEANGKVFSRRIHW